MKEIKLIGANSISYVSTAAKVRDSIKGDLPYLLFTLYKSGGTLAEVMGTITGKVLDNLIAKVAELEEDGIVVTWHSFLTEKDCKRWLDNSRDFDS